ncbi:MAG: AsmA family protein [Alphaproteobacteria bacterium]|nr:AsmA family protein [Alphaproteobacteria bacterium]
MKRLRRTLISLGLLVAVLGAAVALVPWFVNLEFLQRTAELEASKALGQPVRIAGPVTVSLVPSPMMTARDVGAGGPEGDPSAWRLHTKQLHIELSLAALMRGGIEVKRVVLRQPELEVAFAAPANQRPPEQSDPSSAQRPGSAPDAAEPDALFPSDIALDAMQVVVEDGQIRWLSEPVDALHVSELNAVITGSEGASTLSSTGSFHVSGTPIDFVAAFDRSASENRPGQSLPFSLAVRAPTSETIARLRGGLDADARLFEGQVELSSANLAALLGAAEPVTDPAEQTSTASKTLSAQANFSVADAEIRLRELTVDVDGSRATGSATMQLADACRSTATLNFERVDLDWWRTQLAGAKQDAKGDHASQAGDTAPPPKDRAAARPPSPSDPTATSNCTTPRTIQLVIGADQATLRSETLRNLSAALVWSDDQVELVDGQAQLPGATSLRLSGRATSLSDPADFRGAIEMETREPMRLAQWLGLELDALRLDGFDRIALQSEVELTPGKVSLAAAKADLDDSHWTGDVSVAELPSGSPRIEISGTVDKLDFDRLLGAQSRNSGSPYQAAAAPSGSGAPPTDAKEASEPLQLALDLSVDNAVIRGTAATGLALKAEKRGELWQLHSAKVDDLAGASGRLSGRLQPAGAQQRFEGLFDIKVSDPARLFALSQVVPPVPPDDLGPFAARGSVRGVPADFAFDVELDALAGRNRLDGRLYTTPSKIGLVVDLTARYPALAPLLKLAAPETARALGNQANGPVAMTASISGDASSLEFSGRSQVFGGAVELTGTITDYLAPKPKYDLAFDGQVDGAGAVVPLLLPELKRLLDWLGLRERLAAFGPVPLKGRINGGGPEGRLDFDGRLRLLDSPVDVRSRAVGRGQGNGKLDTSIKARIGDLGRWVKVLGSSEASVETARAIGPMAISIEAAGPDENVRIDSRVELNKGLIEIDGALDTSAKAPRFDLSMNASITNGLDVLRLMAPDYRPAVSPFGRIAVRTKFSGTANRVELRGIKAEVGPISLRGTSTIDLTTPRPKVTVDLNGADDMLLDLVLPPRAELAQPIRQAMRDWSQRTAVASTRPGVVQVAAAQVAAATPAGSPLDFSALQGFDAEVKFRAPSITVGKLLFPNPVLEASLNEGVLKVDELQTGFLGGRIAATGTLDTQGKVPSITVEASGEEFDLGHAMVLARLNALVIEFRGIQLGRIGIVGGKTGFQANFKTSGQHDRELLAGLEAEIALDGQNIEVAGLGLKNLGQAIERGCRYVDAASIVRSHLFDGDTTFDRLSGAIVIKPGGKLGFRDLEMIGPDGRMALVSDIRLLDLWAETLQLRISLARPTRVPKFGLDFRGPLSRLDSRARIDRLLNYISRNSGRC